MKVHVPTVRDSAWLTIGIRVVGSQILVLKLHVFEVTISVRRENIELIVMVITRARVYFVLTNPRVRVIFTRAMVVSITLVHMKNVNLIVLRGNTERIAV